MSSSEAVQMSAPSRGGALTRSSVSACTLSLVCSLLFFSCGPELEVRSSIVVVTIDTLRADHLGLYGYPRNTSPFLDELAKEAIVFDTVVSSMAVTLPAHVSLWSSQYPLQTGVLANGKRFRNVDDRGIRFFAEILKEGGYSTAAVVSASPVKRRSGIDVGFDFFSEPVKEKRRADRAIDLALDWISTARSDPFFLWVHLFDPHWPYDPPGFYRDLFSTDDALIDFLKRNRYSNPQDESVQQTNNFYDGEIRFVDAQLERFTEGLMEQGLYDGLTLVVTSDHGEGLGQHNRAFHGEVFSEQLRIPLIMKFPKSLQVTPYRYTGLTSIIDIVPTVLGTLRLEIDRRDEAQFEGMDLLGGKRQRKFLFSQRSLRTIEWKKIQQFALEDADWKLVMSTDGQEVLYHLRRDPGEYFNVANQHPDQAARLRGQIRSLLTKYSRQGKGLKVLEETSTQTLEELRSLGYLN